MLSLALAIPFTILGIRTSQIDKDWSSLKSDPTYINKVESGDINLVTQHVSCGYATIEMMSEYYGNKISEDELKEKNHGSISTSSTDGFYKELKSSIKTQSFVKKTYLNNTSYLKEIHQSLKNNHPVAIEWAAQYEGEWTLHFSIVTSIDIANERVIVYNPYGSIENISIDTFLLRTTFKAYKNIPLFLNFGFAFGAFDKNALFHAK